LKRVLLTLGVATVAAASQAAYIIIDDFTAGHFAYELGGPGNPSAYVENHTGIGGLNANRRIAGSIDPVSGSATQVSQSIFGGRFQVQNNQGVRAFVNMDYQFAPTDFLQYSTLRFHFFVNNAALPQFDITVFDSMGRTATRVGPLSASLQPSTFDFNIWFFNKQAGFDMSSVNRININLRTDYSHDFDMRRIEARAIPGPAAALAFASGILVRRRRKA
jgi:hypothetical protein